MYPELEKYYNECLGDKGFSESEKDKILKVTETLYWLNLLTIEEYISIKDTLSGVMGRKISTLPFNIRIQNALFNAGIKSCRQLRELLINSSGEESLFRVRNLGSKNTIILIENSCEFGIATYDEVRNAKWTYYRKKIIEEATKNKCE